MKPLEIGTRVTYSERCAGARRALSYDYGDLGEVTSTTRLDHGWIDRRDERSGDAALLHALGFEGKLPIPWSLPSRPARDGEAAGAPRELDRWLQRWPIKAPPAFVYVVGLTYRQDGWWDSEQVGEMGYEGVQRYLHELRRTPVYEVKVSIRARGYLVPADAVTVLP